MSKFGKTEYIIMAVIGVTALLILFIVILIAIYSFIKNKISERNINFLELGRVIQSKEKISLIKQFIEENTKKYSKIDQNPENGENSENPENGVNEEDCSICLETFLENESVAIMDCDHIFHPICIFGWFILGKLKCPYCTKTFEELEQIVQTNYNEEETTLVLY